jgi:hypothetical protein
MLLEGMLLIQTLGLQFSADDLKRVGHGGGQHARRNAGHDLVYAQIFEFLVEHVVETSKGAFFYATGESPAEEGFGTFLLVNVSSCCPDGTVPMKVCQLEAGFDYTQWVG